MTQSSCFFIILFLHFHHFNLTSPKLPLLSVSLSLSLLPRFTSRTRKWSTSFGFNHRDALPGHPVHPSPGLCFPRCMAGGREIASTKPQEPAVMCKSTTTTTTTAARRRRRAGARAHIRILSSPTRRTHVHAYVSLLFPRAATSHELSSSIPPKPPLSFSLFLPLSSHVFVSRTALIFGVTALSAGPDLDAASGVLSMF